MLVDLIAKHLWARPGRPERRRRARRNTDRIRMALIGLLTLLAVVELVAVGTLAWQDVRDHEATRHANSALRQASRNTMLLERQQALAAAAILHGCERLNVQRALDNASHYADYQFISQQVHFQTVSLRSNYLALARIGLPKALLNRALKQELASLASQRRQAAAKEWVPLSDCAAVVPREGASYTPPLPIPFTEGNPPASALDPKNAARADPAGSVA